MVPSSVYLESLRRGMDGSLAHWDSVWPEDIAAEPLPQDTRCEIELLPSTAIVAASPIVRIAPPPFHSLSGSCPRVSI